MSRKGAAIFLRCSEQEAEKIREAARVERRTVSGFIVNAVLNRITFREQLQRTAKNRRHAQSSRFKKKEQCFPTNLSTPAMSDGAATEANQRR